MKISATVLLLAALVVTNGMWAYIYVDRVAALEQRSDEVSRQRGIADQLAALLIDLPRDRGVEWTLRYLSKKYPGTIVKAEADTLYAGDLILEFDGTRISRVHF
jgi:hypothetical protein